MSTLRHSGGMLRPLSRPQPQLPASSAAGSGTAPAAKSASASPDPAEITAREQANVQREREQRAEVFRHHIALEGDAFPVLRPTLLTRLDAVRRQAAAAWSRRQISIAIEHQT